MSINQANTRAKHNQKIQHKGIIDLEQALTQGTFTGHKGKQQMRAGSKHSIHIHQDHVA